MRNAKRKHEQISKRFQKCRHRFSVRFATRLNMLLEMLIEYYSRMNAIGIGRDWFDLVENMYAMRSLCVCMSRMNNGRNSNIITWYRRRFINLYDDMTVSICVNYIKSKRYFVATYTKIYLPNTLQLPVIRNHRMITSYLENMNINEHSLHSFELDELMLSTWDSYFSSFFTTLLHISCMTIYVSRDRFRLSHSRQWFSRFTSSPVILMWSSLI